MKAYLDNVICSGLALRDLDPPAEMSATLALVSARDRGELNLVTSVESWREQDRTKNPEQRATLRESREGVPRVKQDHTVLGFAHCADHLGGFVANPLVTDMVDESLFQRLKTVGLADADARHVMYAVHSNCDRFVTLDARDLLPRRSQVETVCAGLKVVTPVQLATELGVA